MHRKVLSRPSCFASTEEKSKKVRFSRNKRSGKVKVSFIDPSRDPKDMVHPHTTWYTRDELNGIKQEAFQVTQSLQAVETVTIDGGRTTSYRKTLSRAYKSCEEDKDDLTGTEKKDICFWATLGHSRRGLEKYIISELGEERDKRRMFCRESVLYVQQKCREEAIFGEQRHCYLRYASEKFSKTSRRFSQIMAKADSVAVGTGGIVEERLAMALAAQMPTKLCERQRTPSPPSGQQKPKPCFNPAA